MKFSTIVADPPWDYETYGPGGHSRSPENHYPVMTLSDILKMPVQDVCAPNAVLLLWCTWPHLAQGLQVIEAWGFEYKTGLPWLKLTKDMLPRMGTGYHTRGCTEPILIATRGKGACPSQVEREAGVLFNKIGSHSAKPTDQYRMAEKYPGPYLEIFARPWWGPFDPPCGWTCIGNEITGRDICEDLALLAKLPQPHAIRLEEVVAPLLEQSLFGQVAE